MPNIRKYGHSTRQKLPKTSKSRSKSSFFDILHFCLSTGIIAFCETGFQPIAIIFSFLKSTLPKVSKEKRINEKFQVAWIL
jgi:hypothetical protein